MPTLLRPLLSLALLLALSAPASAQMDASTKMECFEKLLTSIEEEYQTQDGPSPGTIPSGSTIIRLENDGFYVAVNGAGPPDGITKKSEGQYSLGNGSFYLSPTGDPTDCSLSPDECRELLENANDDVGGGEETPPAEPPAESEPATQSLPGGEPEYFYQFQVRRDGRMVYSADRRLRGVWGYRFEPRLCD